MLKTTRHLATLAVLGFFVCFSAEGTAQSQSLGSMGAQKDSADIDRSTEFGTLNLVVLCFYPLIMLGIGIWCSTKGNDAEGFFRAGQQVPWWAAGLSIYATMLSSITFMAVPAKAYSTNWWFTLNSFSIILLAPIIVHVYLPFFRQLNLTCAYEYLELRFNLAMRMFGSASFIVFQVARTGVVLYLPALAMATVSNLDTGTCIVCMGLLTIAVTYFGGMEAVIWTDVAQTILLLAAALLSLFVILGRLDGSILENVQVASQEGKFYPPISFSLNLAKETFWVILIGNGFTSLISYTSNQEVVQRFMTTANEKEAGRAIWTNAWLTIPSALIFFGVGTALFLFYQQFPSRLDPNLSRNDAIFPYFMVHELPPGLAGFVVAGIFAAAQPTSSLNSVATAWTTDFYQRFHPAAGPTALVRVGRISTFIAGVLGMIAALILDNYPVESIWELFLNIIGLTTGILAGLFSLGILTKRATGAGAIMGVLISIATLTIVALTHVVHPLMFGFVGVTSTFIGGYLMSLIGKNELRDLKGLTIYTLNTSVPALRPPESQAAPSL